MSEKKTSEMVIISYEVTAEQAQVMDSATASSWEYEIIDKARQSARDALAARKSKYERFMEMVEDGEFASEIMRQAGLTDETALVCGAGPKLLEALILSYKYGRFSDYENLRAVEKAIREALPEAVADEVLGE